MGASSTGDARSTPGKGNPSGGRSLQDAGTVLPQRSPSDTKFQCVQLKLVHGTRITQTEDILMLVVEEGLTAQSSVGRQRLCPQQRVTFTWIIKVIQLYQQCNTKERPGDVQILQFYTESFLENIFLLKVLKATMCGMHLVHKPKILFSQQNYFLMQL